MKWSEEVGMPSFKTIGLFLVAAVDEKTATQKPKQVKILATLCSFFTSPKLQ
jgi:hypothetical protein